MKRNPDNKGSRPESIPLSLVLLDNIPTLLLFVLGTMLLARLSAVAAVVFAAYLVLSIVLFWARICPGCHFYNTLACPCGYGIISAKLFKRKEGRPFSRTFKRNIIIMFPNWFVPFLTGVYLLVTRYSTATLVLTILFSLDGFLVIPLVSKLAGCRNCSINEQCPWMNGKSTE